jgi:hypothetical protein|nr:MAG TPA: IrrE protein [Caudoviricetes sp.]DAR97662.1 MAG TPA: IrrE protein [Caudoviricetes sp.]
MSNLIVKEKPLINNDGLISGNRIAIRKNIATTTEKACVLAEELGHHYTTTGNILDQQNVVNAKQELHARTWAYNECIGLIGIVKAFESGCKSLYEMADYLNVTEDFLKDALESFRRKYGIYTEIDNYFIFFEPYISVMRKYT